MPEITGMSPAVCWGGLFVLSFVFWRLSLFFCLFVEMGSHYKALTVPELTLETRLPSNPRVLGLKSEGLPPSDWPGGPLLGISMVLESTREQAEQAVKNAAESSSPSFPLLRFLSPGPCF